MINDPDFPGPYQSLLRSVSPEDPKVPAIGLVLSICGVVLAVAALVLGRLGY